MSFPRIPLQSRAYPLATQLTEPGGFWVSAAHGQFGHNCVKKISALRADAACPPPVENPKVLAVTAPAEGGQGVDIPLAGYLSALISGRVVSPSVRALRAVVSQLSTRPDSLIPSRIAAFTTRYVTHAPTIKSMAATANANIACLCISSSTCRCRASKFITFSFFQIVGAA